MQNLHRILLFTNNTMLSDCEIAYKIKPLTPEMCDTDYNELFVKAQQIKDGRENVVTERSRVGNNVVDFFTYEERLRTRSKYNIHFFDFVDRIEEFKEKKFIRNMLTYYENVKNKNKTKNEYVVLKEVFNICIGAVNIFRPLVAMEMYAKFQPTHVLDICAGWGGRCIGAAAMDVPNYTGVEINHGLQDGYAKMKEYLSARSSTNITMRFESALDTNYSALEPYDMVLTSPPYYFLEKYSHNAPYANKREMDEKFYKPLVERSYAHLQPGGHFVFNVNKEIYDNTCVPILGEAHSILPFKKSKRQNNYTECIYIWTKT